MARAPNAVELPVALAGLYVERNRAAEAKHLLDQVEADKNHFPDGHRAVATFYLDNGDAASALDRFRALVAGNESDLDAGQKVAECYLQVSRWHDADLWLEQHDKNHERSLPYRSVGKPGIDMESLFHEERRGAIESGES